MHKRVVHKEAEEFEDVVVEVLKVQYVEEIIERPVEQFVHVPRYVEAPHVQEHMHALHMHRSLALHMHA